MRVKKQETNYNLIDLITPVGGLTFERNKIYLGNRYCKIYTIIHYPSNIEMKWLGNLVANTGAIFSINIEPTDNAELIDSLDSRIRDASGLAQISKNESSRQMREQEIHEASEIINRMIQNNEVVSYLTIYILISAEEKEELKLKCKEVESEVQHQKLKIRNLTNYLQMSGFKAIAPFFTIQTDLSKKFKRNILTSSFTGGFLFNTDTFIDEGGYYWGVNQNGGIIIFNLWKQDQMRGNSNMFVVGSSGSGKSIAVKHMILNEIPTTKVLIIDPENEYSYLCKNLNGKIINCNGKEKEGILNPLQIRVSRDNEDDDSALSLHFQFLETFFKILYPSLNEIEISKLDIILERLYKKFGISKDTDISKLENTDFPILEDLYYFIKQENDKNQNEIYDKLLALIRPIAIGQASNIWNGYTNIEVTTRVAVFNTSTMQKFQIQYKRAQYYNILSYAWDILSKDKERTMLVADECHILIDPNIPQTLEYLRYISKMARKHNSAICVITQSIEDFLNEKIKLYGQSLLSNATNKLFFKCDGKDLKDIVSTFNLTEQEEKMLLNAKVGECLFMCGTRKLYMIFKLFEYELEMIDSKFVKDSKYD